MINHRHKFIFIHIPRTAGTSIELAFDGRDWWKHKPNEKHMSASQARKFYGEKIWQSYFKFSFVRNPWDRVISLWKSNYYYKTDNLFKFLLHYKPEKHEYSSPKYSDILDEDINFVGRFENLKKDFREVCDIIGIQDAELPHAEQRTRNHYSSYYNNITANIVKYIFLEDIREYNYEFTNISPNRNINLESKLAYRLSKNSFLLLKNFVN